MGKWLLGFYEELGNFAAIHFATSNGSKLKYNMILCACCPGRADVSSIYAVYIKVLAKYEPQYDLKANFNNRMLLCCCHSPLI